VVTGLKFKSFLPQISQMNTDLDINKLTEVVIGCAYRVGSTLGGGFLEKVYENALMVELRNTDYSAEQQCTMKVIYSGEVVGDYIADIVVEKKLIVEVKAAKRIEQAHVAQCLNYLKATNMRLGLLINFGASVEIRRVINGV
jgi:GxxExxY protein